jgi:hypothetical protein
MAQHEDSSAIALQELQQTSVGRDDQYRDQTLVSRSLDRKRMLALVGSALSQLPIWGSSNLMNDKA